MQRQVGSLRARLGASNTRLQGAGRSLLERVDALTAILRVQQGLADTRQVRRGQGQGNRGRRGILGVWGRRTFRV